MEVLPDEGKRSKILPVTLSRITRKHSRVSVNSMTAIFDPSAEMAGEKYRALP